MRRSLYPPPADDGSPVLIGWGELPTLTAAVLINLTHAMLAFFLSASSGWWN